MPTTQPLSAQGASGAIWGLMTSMALWVVLNRQFLSPPLVSSFLRRMLLVFMINVGISLAPGISAAAHFGGGGAGVLLAVLLNTNRFGVGWLRGLALLGVVLFPLVDLGALWFDQTHTSHWDSTEKLVIYSEMVTLRNEVVVPTQGYEDKARLAFRQAERLLEESPDRRGGTQVEDALKALEQARSEIAGANELLRSVGACHGKAEEFRLARAESLAAWDTLCAMTANLLAQENRTKPRTGVRSRNN